MHIPNPGNYVIAAQAQASGRLRRHGRGSLVVALSERERKEDPIGVLNRGVLGTMAGWVQGSLVADAADVGFECCMLWWF